MSMLPNKDLKQLLRTLRDSGVLEYEVPGQIKLKLAEQAPADIPTPGQVAAALTGQAEADEQPELTPEQLLMWSATSPTSEEA